MSVRQQSKHELVAAQRERYRRARRADKTQILDEFVAATGYHWTECVGVWGKGQAAVFTALAQARARLPVPLLGIDSDNGPEFLNAHLVRWCAQEQVTFTRSRPYWKNDQAHMEQKNWSIVRRLLGYDRYESEAALAALQAVYAALHGWINHWQPVLKLVAKERVGARVRKRYDTAQTPYRRMLAWAGIPAGAATQLYKLPQRTPALAAP